MRSIKRILSGVMLGAAFVTTVAGCAQEVQDRGVPVIDVLGTRAFEYDSIDQLAQKASAIVVVRPTGNGHDVPFPADQGGTDNSAPTSFQTLEVVRVLSGSVDGKTIDVVSPGLDDRTGKSAIAAGGPFILFIAPAMYGPDQPVGGFAIVGGPAGMYAQSGGRYLRVDEESPRLPDSLDPATTTWPAITKTAAQLLHEGP